MIFADSTFFIGLLRTQDQFHPRALELIRSFDNAGERLIFTPHVLSEVTTFIKKRDGAKTARKKGLELLASPQIEVFIETKELLENALELMGKYETETFSFCDALSAAAMREVGIKNIVSFDSDFDLIKNIERIY